MLEKTRITDSVVAALPALVLLVGACGAGSDGSDELEIAGSYTDDYDSTHDVTAETWTTTGPMGDVSVFHILEFDNTGSFLVAQNDGDNAYAADKYSRFDWTDHDGALHYCQSVYDGETEADARDAEGADPDDLETGCSGFPWSTLTPE